MNKGFIIIGALVAVGGGLGYYLYSENEKKKKASATVATKPTSTHTTVKEVKDVGAAAYEDWKDGKIDDTKSYLTYVTGAPQLSLSAEQYLADQNFLNNTENFEVNTNIDVLANLQKKNEILKTDYSEQKAEIANQQAIVQGTVSNPNYGTQLTMQLNEYYLKNPNAIELGIPKYVNPILKAEVVDLDPEYDIFRGKIVEGQWKNPDCFEIKWGGLLKCFKPHQIKILPQDDLGRLYTFHNQLGSLL
jgi:hypothetical protein